MMPPDDSHPAWESAPISVNVSITVSGPGPHGTVQYALLVQGVQVAECWDWSTTAPHEVLRELLQRWL